jgi:hypothetical protein
MAHHRLKHGLNPFWCTYISLLGLSPYPHSPDLGQRIIGRSAVMMYQYMHALSGQL